MAVLIGIFRLIRAAVLVVVGLGALLGVKAPFQGAVRAPWLVGREVRELRGPGHARPAGPLECPHARPVFRDAVQHHGPLIVELRGEDRDVVRSPEEADTQPAFGPPPWETRSALWSPLTSPNQFLEFASTTRLLEIHDGAKSPQKPAMPTASQ